MPNEPVLIICMIVFLLLFGAAQVVSWLGRRRVRAAKKGIAYQIQKSKRVAQGWRPALWDKGDPTVTDDEKIAAILDYSRGDSIPLSGAEARRQRLQPPAKRRRK